MNGDDDFEVSNVKAPDGSNIPVRHPKGADDALIKQFAAREYFKTHTPPAPTVTASSASPDAIDLTAAAANVDPVEFATAIPRGAVRGLVSVPALMGEMGRAEMAAAAAPFTDKPDLPPSATVEQLAEPVAAGIEKVTGGYLPMEKPTTPSGEAGERVGEFLGDPASWIGPGGPIVKTIGAIGGGLGSYIGEQVGGTKGSLLGGAIGGGVTGLASPRGLPARPPRAVRAATTEEATKAASQSAYKEMDALQFQLPPPQARQLQDAIGKQLIAEGYRPYAGSAPGVFRTIKEISTPYAQPGTLRTMGGITVGDLEAARQSLNVMRMGTDRNEAKAASAAIEGIDDYLLNLPGVAGISERARKNWAAYKRGQIVEETLRRALDRAASSGVGANVDNAIKQEFKRRIRDKENVWRTFSPAEQAEIEKIIKPGVALNFARYLSRFGPRHLLYAMMSGGLIGHFTHSPLTALGALTTGEVAHQVGKRATHGRAERLAEITRARSPAGGYYTPPEPPGRLERALAGTARGTVAGALELPEITVTPQ